MNYWKKILPVFIITLCFMMGCDDTVDPEGDFFQQFAMNCVIRGDSSHQIATVFSSYPNDSARYSEFGDNFVEGVDLRLWYDIEGEDRVYIFRDSSLLLESESGVQELVKFYYIDGLKIEHGRKMEIEAIFPTGKRLKSNTIIEDKLREVEHDYFIPPQLAGQNFIRIAWEVLEGDEERIIEPKIIIPYYFLGNGSEEYREIVVPYSLLEENGSTRLLYPRPSFNADIRYEMSAINWALQKISEGDPNKENYKIFPAKIFLLLYDKNLSSYYASTNGFLDDFSIRIDEIDFSNIEGGLGLFGSYIIQKYDIDFRTDYLIEYGYRIGKQ